MVFARDAGWKNSILHGHIEVNKAPQRYTWKEDWPNNFYSQPFTKQYWLWTRQQRPKSKKELITVDSFLPLGSEMVFARGARSKNTYVEGIFDIRPRKGIPVKKKVAQTFSLLSLHKPYWWWTNKKDQNQRKKKIVFRPWGLKWFLPGVPVQKTRMWMEFLILDPARVYL